VPDSESERVLFDAFRADPEANPLKTPSGKIELFSEKIARFGYDDCPGHAAWLECDEWLGSPRAQRFPLALVANTATRLHGQLDLGAYSQASKVNGREPVRIHPSDAARGIADGDVVRLWNDRGSCLAGAVLDDVRLSVVQLRPAPGSTPTTRGRARDVRARNPNLLTRDVGTSRLAQGCSASTRSWSSSVSTASPRRCARSIRRGSSDARIGSFAPFAAVTACSPSLRRAIRAVWNPVGPAGSGPWLKDEASFRAASSRKRSTGFEVSASSSTRISPPSTPSRRARSFKL
jgi:hypothetical protein